MPRYLYKASTADGKILEGVMEGENEKLIIERLRKENYFPLSIKEEQVPKKTLLYIKSSDVASFTQQLSILISSGVPLERSLSILTELTQNKKFKTIISEITQDIRKGNSFSKALSSHPKIFSPLYTNMIKVGEASGALDAILATLANFTKREEDLKSYLKSMMIYPIILSLVGGSALIVIFTFVIPRFTLIFEEMGQALPLPTQILISISSFLTQFWWIILCAILLLFFGLKRFASSEFGREIFDRIKLKAPLIGKLTQVASAGRFSHSLGTLIGGGVPLLEALQILKDAVGNKIISRGIEKIYTNIREGDSIAKPLGKIGVFPPLLVHMVAVGEESGNLKDVLLRLSNTYDTKLKEYIRSLVALIEPAIIIVMGGIVAFIVASILLPIFAMTQLPF